MWCMQCKHELSECECPDLQERLDSLKNCEQLHIGAEYLKRLEKQAENPKKEKTE